MLSGEFPLEIGNSFKGADGVLLFNFKVRPNSVEGGKEGSYRQNSQDALLTLPSTNGGAFEFDGIVNQHKSSDCVLVFDQDKKVFVLERIESVLSFANPRKVERENGDESDSFSDLENEMNAALEQESEQEKVNGENLNSTLISAMEVVEKKRPVSLAALTGIEESESEESSSD